jgi:hypothetical protein
MISSTWSQIAQPEKSNSLLITSPMSALTNSPLIRNSSVPGNSGVSNLQASAISSAKQQLLFPDMNNSQSAMDMNHLQENNGDKIIGKLKILKEFVFCLANLIIIYYNHSKSEENQPTRNSQTPNFWQNHSFQTQIKQYLLAYTMQTMCFKQHQRCTFCHHP